MPIKNINPLEAKSWLDSEEAILIDVREEDEHLEASINGAKLIPLNKIHIDEISDHANKKIILHCHSGGRSSRACSLLQAQNANIDFYNLEGGIKAWQEANLPIKVS